MREAVARGEGLMRRMIEGARPLLHQRAMAAVDPAERARQQEILRRLNVNEDFLVRRFPELLRSELLGAAPAAQVVTGAISFDQLELMDDDQIEERVEIARVLQGVVDHTESHLEEFNRLICGAQGLGRVVVDRNPLRPETYARALRAVLSETGETRAVRLAWLHGMGDSLGEGLAQTYDDLCRSLREAGIEPASYQIVQDAVKANPTRVTQVGAEVSLLTLDHLHRLLSGDFDEEARAETGDRSGRQGPAFSPTVPAAFEALLEMNQVDAVVRRMSDRLQEGGDTHETPNGAEGLHGDAMQVREALRRSARGVGQTLGLEVVSLMVDNMAGDMRLPAPVREAVRTLEPALLRLVLHDPRFFSDRHHPARRLLDEMTRRGLGFRSEAEEGFDAFIGPLRSAVNALASVVVEGPDPFDLALQALHEEWRQQARREQARREKARKALESAEQRHMLAEKISGALRARADMALAHPAIVGMLVGPWAQVMARNRQEGGDPGADEELVADLLWSANPELARRNRSRLLRLVPEMIQRLRQGLGRIECPAARQEAFFEVLMSLHQQALKPLEGSGAKVTARADGAASGPVDRAAAVLRDEVEARFSRAEEDADVWLVQREVQDSGFFDLQPASEPGAVSPGPMSGSGETEETASMLDLMARPGTWIELWIQDKWVRAQLNWASPQGKLFMYVGSGGTAHSLSRRSLRHLLAEGRVRLLASQAPIDGALDAVAQRALQNSIAVK